MALRCWMAVIGFGLLLDPLSASPPLDAAVEALFALDMSPGMAVAVVRGSEVVYLRGFGFRELETRRPVTPDTIFYIASTTKSFTAFAAALLRAVAGGAGFRLREPGLQRRQPGAR